MDTEADAISTGAERREQESIGFRMNTIEFKLGGLIHLSRQGAAVRLGEISVDSMIIGNSIRDVLDKVELCKAHGPPGMRYVASQRCLFWPGGFFTVVTASSQSLNQVRGLSVGAVWLSNLTPEKIEGWVNVEQSLRLDPMVIMSTVG